jgi:hypothetical protein
MWIQNHNWEKVAFCADVSIRNSENHSPHADMKLGYLRDKPLLLFFTPTGEDSLVSHNPVSSGRLLAGNACVNMNTLDSRIHFLNEHLRGLQRCSPFLTVSSNPERFVEQVAHVADTFGVAVSVILTDPHARFRAGLLILHYQEEALRYLTCKEYELGSLDRDFRLHKDDCLCPWKITPKEVVCMWDWSALKNQFNWYQTIVEPELRRQQQGK